MEDKCPCERILITDPEGEAHGLWCSHCDRIFEKLPDGSLKEIWPDAAEND